MKTADDWANRFKLHSCMGNKKFEAQIKQIQLDAYRAGMTEAAELIQPKIPETKQETIERILSARDKKEMI